jgi:phosphoribosylaminoimidazolecarboxamide formyltransferase/IMP cyclohydrolase
MELGRIQVHRALISVSNKAGIVEFARRLADSGVELISSGGTASELRKAGIEVILVSDVTAFPEILAGRVKTLHPRIHGAILADPTDSDHQSDLTLHSIAPIELVVSNLYPFEINPSIEEIDIGGVALTRAAAKNYEFVGVVTDPSQYDEVAREVESGGLKAETRRYLARAAFFRTAVYDAAIVRWLEGDDPARMVVGLERGPSLRYGENPHQQAMVWRERGTEPWWEQADYLGGKEISFNNVADADSAWRLANDIAEPAVVIVKHGNPCGVALGRTIEDAFEKAWDCDPLSAFGGVVAANRPVNAALATALGEKFVEVVIAPAFETTDGIGSAVRTIAAPPPHNLDFDWRRIEDGFLIQDRDRGFELTSQDLALAERVVAHTKSNAVVIVRDGAAVGIGAGDQSRVGAVQKALRQAGVRSQGAVAASDAFFPFPDAVEALAAAGVVAIAAPSGSRNDQIVAESAARLGVDLIHTKFRHFRH